MKRHASMNRVYRLIWSRTWNAWVAVAETARGRGKASGRTLIAAALSLSTAFAQAAPIGEQVTAGTGSVSRSGTTTTIQQSSQNLSLNWASFNIAKQETVTFQQPSAAAIAVNRIFDTNGTQILGQLNANGQVYLINPNGILFGQGAQVNVGALVASTLELNDASLNAEMRSFSGNGAGSIVNQGTINAASGGYVALLGNQVSNQGTITAHLGAVALGAGSAATLTFSGNSLVKMQVDQSVLNSVAENGGLIRADGGMVAMHAGAKNALLASVVNNTGVVEARTVENHDGVITLLGGMTAGTVNVGGTLDASNASGGKGGTVQLLGNRVGLFAANVDVSGDSGGGTLLGGGDYMGGNPGIQNASATYMSADSTISADAIANGTGGKVVLWSNESTRAYGRITARGGAEGGNGGLIETSGHWLDVSGIKVDASAPHGNAGTWLLDPFNVTISGVASSSGAFGGGIWTPTASGSNIFVGDIRSNLAGTDVTITTTGAGAEAGNITWSAGAALNYDGIGTVSNRTLALKAANNIVFNGGSITDLNTATADKLNVVLNADADASGAGNIQMNAGASIVSNGGNITLGGGANPLTTAAVGSSITLQEYYGVHLADATLNAGAGNISIRGTGLADPFAGIGVFAGGNAGGTVIRTTSGDITLSGTGGAGAVGRVGVWLDGAGTNITSSNGAISITGQAAGTDSTNHGIFMQRGAAITSADTATITLNGTGGAGTNDNYGVSISNTGTHISSLNGAISITGQGAGTAERNRGILIFDGAKLTSTGTATITLSGTGGAGTDNNFGVDLNGFGTRIESSNGAISITGQGAGTGIGNSGIRMVSAAVTSTDTATITLNGTGGGGTDNNHGVLLSDFGANIESANGAISITGQGGGTGVTNHGVMMADNAAVTSTGAATITMLGAGSSLGTDNNVGVYLTGAGTNVTSATGEIFITGQGGGNATNNYGIAMDSGAAVISTDTAGITLNGTGGAGIDGNAGVYLNSVDTLVTSVNGAISITGQGAGTGQSNDGITMIGGAAVTSTDAATITLNGTSGAGIDSNYGVYLTSSANVTSSNGAISITGQSAGTGERNYGIHLSDAAVTATGAATITLNGTGSGAGTDENYGVYLYGEDTIISSLNGTISIMGQGAGTGVSNYGIFIEEGAAVTATGVANITLDGRGAGGAEGIFTTTSGLNNVIGGATGNITLIADTASGADSIFLSAVEISGSGNLVLQPLNAATSIGLAGGAGTFNLDASDELPTIQPGFASITIGRANGTGAIAFGDGTGAGFTFNANTTLRNPGAASGGITINEPISVDAMTLTLDSTGAVTQTAAITAGGLQLLGAGGTHTLTSTDSGFGAGNAITTLAGSTGAVNFQQTGSLAIGSVGGTIGLAASDGVLVRTAGATADLILTNGVTANGAGNSLVLAAGRNFHNNAGAGALDAPNGRWLVYSTSPAGSTENGLTAAAGSASPRLYNRTFDGNPPATIAAGNHLIYSTQPSLTVTAGNQTRLYGDANAAFTSAVTAGFVSDDGVTDTTSTVGLTGAAALTSLATATSAVSGPTFPITAAAGDLASGAGYAFNFADGVLTINPAALAVIAVSPPDPFINVATQPGFNIFSPRASTEPEELSLSPTVTVIQGSSPDQVPAPGTASDGLGDGAVVNTMMAIGKGMGPSLLVVSGGVRLPDDEEEELSLKSSADRIVDVN